jgi:hypothetical protein
MGQDRGLKFGKKYAQQIGKEESLVYRFDATYHRDRFFQGFLNAHL